jgi:murein DD-endopeptidase MepM/ murein hydrolase activator NlpD
MASHRADHRAPRRRSAPASKAPSGKYVGKRVAGRETPVTPLARVVEDQVEIQLEQPVAQRAEQTIPLAFQQHLEAPAEAAAHAVAPSLAEIAVPTLATAPAEPLIERAPTVELPALSDIPLHDPLVDSSSSLRAVSSVGKRRAVRHAGSRGPLFKGLPSLPVAVGVATIAVAVGGVVTSTTAEPQLTSANGRLTAPNALSGSFGTAAVGTRAESVSRDSDRDALAAASGTDLVAEAERNAEERNSALGALARDAEKEAAEIALNRWVVPIEPGVYRITATYGQYGLWSSYHTGMDFAAPSGTPIRAIANGTITEVGSDGAYGNKTVLTLEDGTELWFCHQSSYAVQEGETVRGGDVIGYVGSTGNTTGPHLHLEVRPGGGDPLDPYAALKAHGVTP